jgi:cephalosporin hydroxylase
MKIERVARKIIGENALNGLHTLCQNYRARQQNHVANKFHVIYYDSGVWQKTTWLGTPVWKCPLDLWLYQEILFTIKPDLIIETGTALGGSALYLASLLDLLGNGQIMSVDIETREDRPRHSRITYVHGSSTAPEIIKSMQQFSEDKKAVIVVLDSDHSKTHVIQEMELYGPLVTRGSYMIVEDTNINGHPVLRDFGSGPYEAVEEYLKNHNDFFIDYEKEKFMISFNVHGYLKKA